MSQEKLTPKKTNLRKCLYCNENVDIANEPFAMPRVNRYAHFSCYEKNFTPDDEFIDKIYAFLTSIHMPYDFLMCERQRNKFVKKLGYTNENILKALKYHYKVNKGDIVASGGRIGIVPYIYDEALKHYKDLEKTQKQLVKNIKTQTEAKQVEVVIGSGSKKEKKNYIDLSKI